MIRISPVQRGGSIGNLSRVAAMVSVAVASVLMTEAASAQEDCKLLFCSPTFILQPGLITTNAVNPPEVRRPDGTVTTLDATTDFLLRFTMRVPTFLPRTSLIGLVQWTPFASALDSPFTGRAASDLNEEAVEANAPAVIYGVTFEPLQMDQTAGWLGVRVGMLGLFSPARKPEDEGFYTHKLLPELALEVGIFNWLRGGSLLRNVTVYGIVNYVATGLSDAGDAAPGGGRLLGDADPWMLIAGLQLPLAPTPIAR